MALSLEYRLEESSISKVDLTNRESISGHLRQHLQQAPNAWIRIRGSHRVKSRQVTDFDVKTKGINARLLRVELRSDSDDLEVVSMHTSAMATGDQSLSTLHEGTIQKFSQAIIELVDTRSYKGMTFQKDTLGIDKIGVQRETVIIGKHAAYGGNIDVEFYDTTSSTTIDSQASQAQGNIFLKTSWVFDWPCLRAGHGTASRLPALVPGQRWKQTWCGRLQGAMVDNEQGWIAQGDPVPPGILYTRALKKYKVKEWSIEDPSLPPGQSKGPFPKAQWGCDE